MFAVSTEFERSSPHPFVLRGVTSGLRSIGNGAVGEGSDQRGRSRPRTYVVAPADSRTTAMPTTAFTCPASSAMPAK